MSEPLPSWRDSNVPNPVRSEMEGLRAALDLEIPPKQTANRNLLIGTWNIKAFASLSLKWLNDWARQANAFGHNALGDFNIDQRGDDLWDAFTRTGLTVPTELHSVRRSIFATANDPKLKKYYDQLAWFEDGGRRKMNLDYVTAGGFDFVPHFCTETCMTNSSAQHRLSDHYPLCAEFNCKD